MKRDNRLYLQDILECIEKVQAYIESLGFEQFLEQSMVRDAVAWNLVVIGEVSAQLPDEFKEKNPSVPWALMKGMRNVVIHGYFGVDWAIVWKTATERLPALREDIARILAAEGEA